MMITVQSRSDKSKMISDYVGLSQVFVANIFRYANNDDDNDGR